MNVIEFNNVSKSYELGTSRTNLREVLAELPGKILSRPTTSKEDNLFWALKDVSFQVEQGEVLGLIGPNGAGKSTTLKLLSKVTIPTSGSIHTQGRMAALIELGAGFHPDLTGRENVFLNGSILGLKLHEIEEQFPNIVEFAGMERFIDTPVKRYSSGMFVRLAFAVAAHIQADLLLVDEVLSVGDITFQQKCMDKMNELRDSGTTIVFVSHNLWAVSSFCERVLLFRNGKIEADGTAKDMIDLYREQERETALEKAKTAKHLSSGHSTEGEGSTALITKIEILNDEGQPTAEFDSQDTMIVECDYVAPRRIESPLFVINISRTSGLTCCAFVNPEEETQPIQGEGTFKVRIGPLYLVPDVYDVQVVLSDRKLALTHFVSTDEPIRIKGRIRHEDSSGVFHPPAKWTMPGSKSSD